MPSPNLENLARIGKLQIDAPSQAEFNGLVACAMSYLGDAKNRSLATASRFTLAYDAAPSLSLAALRWHGYRSDNRYLVFEVLEHTLGIKPPDWRILSECHQRRNLVLYEGALNVDDRILSALIEVTDRVFKAVDKLGLIPGTKPS